MNTKVIILVIIAIVIIGGAVYYFGGYSSDTATQQEEQQEASEGPSTAGDSSAESSKVAFVDCGTADALPALTESNQDAAYFNSFPESVRKVYRCMTETLQSCTPSKMTQLGTEYVAGQPTGQKVTDFGYEVLGKEGDLCKMSISGVRPLSNEVFTKECSFNDVTLEVVYEGVDQKVPGAEDAQSFGLLLALYMVPDTGQSIEQSLPDGRIMKLICR